MELRRHAELFCTKIRWGQIVVLAFLLFGGVPLIWLAAGVAAMAAANLTVLVTSLTPDSFFKSGRRIGSAARLLDLVAITSGLFLAPEAGSRLYLLYFLPVIQAGFVHFGPRQLVVITSCAVICHSTAVTYLGLSDSLPGFPWMKLLTQNALLITGAMLAAYISASKSKEDTMRLRERKLSAIFEYGSRFTSMRDADVVMEQALSALMRESEAASGYVTLLNETGENLNLELFLSYDGSSPPPETVPAGEGIAGYVTQTGVPLMLAAGSSDPNSPISAQDRSFATIGVPLLDRSASVTEKTPKNAVLGVLVLQAARNMEFAQDDLDLATTLGSLTSMAVVNARLYENLHQTFLKTVQSMAISLEARDEYTRGHSDRVTEVSVLVARKLGVPEDVVEEIRLGAQLHDVGKIGVPDAILNKPDKLTDEEFRKMRMHPVIGWEICQPLGLPDLAMLLIRNHHEKLDGSGYPDRLKHGDLPLPLRIVCVVDAFDAMSSTRPYRRSLPREVRLEQLNRFAGTQFDPIVVETIKDLMASSELDEIYREHWGDEMETVASELPEISPEDHPVPLAA